MERQRLQQHGIHDGEHGRVRADAEREREDGNGREPWIFQDCANGIAEILKHGNPYRRTGDPTLQKLPSPERRRKFRRPKSLEQWYSPCEVPRMLDWRRVKNLVGETVREMGRLILVFAPLETAFADAPVNPALLATMFLIGLLLVAGGILIEAREFS